jgi:hypothetical protein
MLSVKYGADVPPAMAEMAEHHARGAGLPLGVLEAVGASLDFIEAFIVASEEGRAEEFAVDAGLLPPKDKVSLGAAQTKRLLGIGTA